MGLYRQRFYDEDSRLFFYRVRHRKLVLCAQVVHALRNRLFPPPRYRARGAAAIYADPRARQRPHPYPLASILWSNRMS